MIVEVYNLNNFFLLYCIYFLLYKWHWLHYDENLFYVSHLIVFKGCI